MNSERLIFEKTKASDYKRFFEIHADPILIKNGYNPISSEIAQEVFQSLLDHWKENNFGTWKIKIKDNPDKTIGFGGIYFREIASFGNVINLGMAFDKKYWGQGYAFETALKSIAFGFEQLQLEKIYAFTNMENISAIKLIEKCNMAFETSFNKEVVYSIKK